MKKTLVSITLFFASLVAATAQVQLGGHPYVPSSTDSNGGAVVLTTGGASTCNLYILAGGCAITYYGGGAVGADGPWVGTIIIGTLAGAPPYTLYIPWTPGRNYTIVNSTAHDILLQAWDITTSAASGTVTDLAGRSQVLLTASFDTSSNQSYETIGPTVNFPTGVLWGNDSTSAPSAISALYYASRVSGTAALPIADCARGASSTGLTDSWAALNAITSAGGNDLEVDGCFALSAALNVGSNTTIHATIPGAGFIMLPASNAPVLQNDNLNAPTTSSGTGGYLVSNQADSNIRVLEVMLNANSLQAVTGSGSPAHKFSPAGLLVFCTNFVGVNLLTLQGNTCYDSGAFQFFFSNDSNVYVQNNTASPLLPIVAEKETDCIHFIGPDEYIFNQNNTLTCGDDSVAYNADDGNRGGDASIASYVKWGPIQHVHDTDNLIVNSYNGLRFYSGSELIDDVTVTNFHGNACGIVGQFDAYTTYGNGNLGTIKIDGWNLPTTWACNPYGLTPVDINLSAAFVNFDFGGLQITNPTTTAPILAVDGAGTNGLLSIHDWKISTQSTTTTNVVELSGSEVRALSLFGNTWDDPSGNSGTFVSGSTVPTRITCSGYDGTRAPLAPGFIPSVENGDCFTNAYTPVTTYINTVFNEVASGTALAGTTPATCTNGCTGPWSLASGTDFTYQAGGGITTSTANVEPTYITSGSLNEVIRFSVTTCTTTGGNACIIYVRGSTTANSTQINISSTAASGGNPQMQIYDCVSSTCILKGTVTGAIVGAYTVTLSGSSMTVVNQTGSAGPFTIGNTSSSNLGFASGAGTVFTVASLSVKSQ